MIALGRVEKRYSCGELILISLDIYMYVFFKEAGSY